MSKTCSRIIFVVVTILALFGVWRFWFMDPKTTSKVSSEPLAACSAAGTAEGSVCSVGGNIVSLDDVRAVMRNATVVIPDYPDTHVQLHDFTAAFKSGLVQGRVTVFPEHLAILPHDEHSADVFTHLVVETGGSGSFNYLAYFSYEPKNNTLLFVDAVELGDRISMTALRVSDAKAVRVELLEHAMGKAMSTGPDMPVALLFAARDGRVYGYRLREDDIVLDTPALAIDITSPLQVKGRAKGIWFFEGSFPVTLTDWDGRTVAEGIATSNEDTMTESFVPFTATLTFTIPEDGDNGMLILKKDNPSGLPEHDAQVAVPVFFSHEYESKG